MKEQKSERWLRKKKQVNLKSLVLSRVRIIETPTLNLTQRKTPKTGRTQEQGEEISGEKKEL